MPADVASISEFSTLEGSGTSSSSTPIILPLPNALMELFFILIEVKELDTPILELSPNTLIFIFSRNICPPSAQVRSPTAVAPVARIKTFSNLIEPQIS